MTLRTSSCAALALLALAATGCGGGDSTSTASSKPPTKAEAAAAAKAINLVKADLPAAWTTEPADTSADSTDNDVVTQLATCLGVSKSEVDDDSSDLADVDSDEFSQGAPPAGVTVSSSVNVVTSEDDAKRDLGLFQSDKAAPCLQEVFDKQIRQELGSTSGLTLGPVTVKKAEPSAAGTDGAFGFTIAVTISGQGVSVPVGVELDGFLKEHTQVSLMTTSFGPAFPTAQRDSLYQKLVDRAKTSAV